ncbi:MAG: SLBB domain-containing protein, partial [Dysgonamonadaceae bacterium]
VQQIRSKEIKRNIHKQHIMKRLTLIYGILTCFLCISISLFAQMSDEQILQDIRNYSNAGMTQEQIYLELTKKGVTVDQLQRLKERYGNRQELATPASAGLMQEAGRTPEVVIAPRGPGAEELVPQENRIFGQDFFSTHHLTFEPNMNMPTPANYILGPGDEIIIDIWGNSELNVRYTIAPDGHITVPGLGRIQLSGMRVDQATAHLRNAFSSIYSDLDSPQPRTFLAISVGNVRTIRVNVMGEVVTPGTYTLSSFASAFHALYAAGGINRIGSLRTIRVFRAGKTEAVVDIYEYLMHGNDAGDITLRDGDIIKVDPYGVLAQITGEVKRPMWYEMKENETLDDLIRFAGGFRGEAYKENVQLRRKGTSEMEVYTVNALQFPDFRMHDGDQITVGNILTRFANRVAIEGAVMRPGSYAIGDDIKTVGDLVKKAQGPREDAFLSRALLYREKADLTPIVESVDVEALLQNRIPDIALRKNDRLFVPSVISLLDNFTVYVGGEVREPGTYAYADNMSIEDAIVQAGGLRESASTARIDVYRRIKKPESTTASDVTGEAFSFSLENGLIISGDKSFTLEPFDQVFVRRSPGYEPQHNVSIEGEVLFGGQYAKVTKDERLSSLVERAGGLTPFAYPKGARLRRQLTEEEQRRTREALMTKISMQGDSLMRENSKLLANVDLSYQYVGIDLEKALKKPGSEDDIVLREGDVLSVPIYNPTVKISGGVLYPNMVTYSKKKNLDDYVKMAGGYSRLAMKGKAFVIYMNGQVATGRRAKIEPGCEIVVPEKPERQPISLPQILGISNSIATLGLIITNLIK